MSACIVITDIRLAGNLRAVLHAEYEGGRHQTRIDMIAEIEETQNLSASK